MRDLRAAGHEIRTHRKPARDAQGVEHRLLPVHEGWSR
ncbi:hypothetical protein [Azotobacter beijerinckii]